MVRQQHSVKYIAQRHRMTVSMIDGQMYFVLPCIWRDIQVSPGYVDWYQKDISLKLI